MLMSMTKLLGGLTAAKAFEEGIMHPSDDIATYLPEYSNLQYYQHNGEELQVLNSTKPIIVRDLLQMRGGFTYDLYSLGPTVPAGVEYYDPEYYALASTIRAQGGAGAASACEALNNVLAFGQPLATLQEIVAACATVPLYHEPGRISRYGLDYDMLGAVLTEALHAKGHSMNAAEYAKAKILDPIGAANFFIGNGELPIPPNAPANMGESTIKRSTTVGMDETVESYIGVRKWLKSEVPGDRWNAFDDALQKTPYVPNMRRAGAFGGGGIATFKDFARLLKLVANRGVHEGERVISEIFLNRCVLPANSADDDLQTIFAGNSPAPEEGDYSIWTSCGAGVTSGGAETVNDGLAFPYVGGFLSWSGYYGTSWMVDMNSGMYAVGGIQATGGERGGIPTPDISKMLFRMSH
jgi:CubicO group peptidase (beta-lactamase class C family)